MHTLIPENLFKTLKFYIPLSLTQMMMALSTPIINAGIARTPNPELGLAAYAIAFAVSTMIHSPIFMTQELSIALIEDRKSFREVMKFCARWGFVLMTLELTIVLLPPTRHFLFQNIIGVSGKVAESAFHAVLFLALIPPLISVRGVFQAIQILRHENLIITVGTFVRLVCFILIVFIGPKYLDVNGAVLGAAALTLGVVIEMMIIYKNARKYVPQLPPESTGESSPDQRTIFKFGLPLMINQSILYLSPFILNSIIARSPHSEYEIATFSVVYTLGILLASPTYSLQQSALALVKDSSSFRRIGRFGLWICFGLMAFMILIIIEPIHTWFFTIFFNLPQELVERIKFPLWILSILPVLMGIRAFFQGLLIKLGKTTSVSVSAFFRVASIFLFAFIGLNYFQIAGAVLGAILLILSLVIEVTILIVRYELQQQNLKNSRGFVFAK